MVVRTFDEALFILRDELDSTKIWIPHVDLEEDDKNQAQASIDE